MLGGEVAAPDDLEVWVAGLQLAAQRHGVVQLSPGHDRHAELVGAGLAHQPIERLQWTRVQVAVDDLVLVDALEQRAERQQRQWQHRLAARRAWRVIQKQTSHGFGQSAISYQPSVALEPWACRLLTADRSGHGTR